MRQPVVAKSKQMRYRHAMHIAAEARRRGVGKALMGAAVEFAQSMPGLRQLNLAVTAGNEAAIVWSTIERQGEVSRTVRGVDVLTLDEIGKIGALHSYWEPNNLPQFE